MADVFESFSIAQYDWRSAQTRPYESKCLTSSTASMPGELQPPDNERRNIFCEKSETQTECLKCCVCVCYVNVFCAETKRNWREIYCHRTREHAAYMM